jgi:nucleoside-diphosphate-sugar epimerase
VVRLLERGWRDIVVLDKHQHNLAVMQKLHPEIVAEYADLSEPGDWHKHFEGAGAVVMLQAQIGGNEADAFERNNITSSQRVLDAMRAAGVPYLVHISSSVVESVADDYYTRSKTAQEELVLASGMDCVVLRPTLMFGWFDRKHLGWLSRFMQRVPVFPIPGHGRYMRQPLYAGDFCNIIINCVERRITGGIYNISGHEKIDYIDMIRAIKQATGARAFIARIPFSMFYALLYVWGKFDRNPPFTTQQLSALCARDEFEVIDWPGIFGTRCTPFRQALDETFNHPRYNRIILEF